MMKRIILLMLVVLLTLTAMAQKPLPAPTGVDRAYLQSGDGRAADATHQKQFYAQGPHVFFDIAPLRHASWDEYDRSD
jgi:hypothetical protein